MSSSAPLTQYERTRFQAVCGIHILSAAALWGQWRRVAVLFAIGAVTFAANAMLYRWVRRTRRFDTVDDVKNSLNAVIVAVVGHACGWPAPVWLFVPMNAMWFAGHKRGTHLKMVAQFAVVALPALADGVPLTVLLAVALFTFIVVRVGEARDALIAQRTAELGNANVALAEAETDRKKMQARLLLADRLTALGTLAGGIAHEINNPLAFVTANLDYVTEELRLVGPTVPRLRELDCVLDETRQGVERVRRVVRDLRSFACDDAREADDAHGADVKDTLGFALKMAASQIRHRARLVNDCPALPRVAAGESRLGQVLLNLLINAAHSIPEGNVEANRIRVSAAVVGARVVVTIEDTGAGMPPHVQASIFDPFFTTKPIGGGMGLGLSICHSIVTGFGGEISFRSEVGRGSAFLVAIPLAPSAADAVAAPAPAGAASRRGRILIVDDDPLVATALRRTLAAHEVELVHSGQAAVSRLADAAPYDLVLCDLLMPDLTGMDVYDHLRERAAAVTERMVFMTGGAFTPRARDFLERVPNARFDKPVDPRWLRTFVRERVNARP